jgi:hypothetical protein
MNTHVGALASDAGDSGDRPTELIKTQQQAATNTAVLAITIKPCCVRGLRPLMVSPKAVSSLG